MRGIFKCLLVFYIVFCILSEINKWKYVVEEGCNLLKDLWSVNDMVKVFN